MQSIGEKYVVDKYPLYVCEQGTPLQCSAVTAAPPHNAVETLYPRPVLQCCSAAGSAIKLDRPSAAEQVVCSR